MEFIAVAAVGPPLQPPSPILPIPLILSKTSPKQPEVLVSKPPLAGRLERAGFRVQRPEARET